MVKQLIDLYFKDNSLVKQQLDSYNRFVEQGIQNIIDRVGTIKTNVEGFEIKLGKVRLEPPRFYEIKGGYRPILPSEARLRNLTYASPIFLEMIPIHNNVEKTIYDEVFIGELPVMVKSNLCYLSRMSKEELTEAAEDPLDPGGYFIINGSERSLITLEDLVPNKMMTTKEDENTIAKTFSVRHGFRARCVVRRSKDGIWYVEFPSATTGITLMGILRVLGFDDDGIEELFNMDISEVKNDVLYNLYLDASKEDAVDWLSKKLSPGQPKEYRDKRMWRLVDEYLLPHLGVEEKDRKKKAYYLARMAQRTTRVYHKKLIQDDRDHYGNKRVKLAGDLMEELFRYAFNFLTKDIIYQASRVDVRGRKLQVHTLVRQDALSDRIMYAMATGNWIAGQTGISQLLDRVSWASSLSHRRRVISPLSKTHPHFLARDLHGTHYGKICPSESPEGASISLVKNLAMFGEVTTGVDDSPVEEVVKNFGIEEDIKKSSKNKSSPVYLNGRFLGFYKDGNALAQRLREKRREGSIDMQVNVLYREETNEVYISTDKGRVRRPYIVVKDGKSLLTPEIMRRIKDGQITWSQLVRIGVIEYLDADEEENAYVAKKESDITPETTHLDSEPSTIFGITAALMPFSNYNSSPRLTMASSMLKQSLGLYAANFNQRFDTKSYVMYYPQQPIVQTAAYKALNFKKRAAGQNFVVAVCTYRGWNIADAVVINKGSIDRGLGRVMMFRTYETEEVSYPSGQKDIIELPSPKVEGYRGEEAYKHLDTDGIVIPESVVKEREVLVGKVSPPRFLEEVSIFGLVEEKRRENSSVVKAGEGGKVDSVLIAEGPSGNKIAKVRLRLPKVPEIGDKVASRHGQKGVIGLILPQEDMPFTESGIVPDLIVNTHAIPSRMTAGHLLEMLAGKAGSLDGKLKDGTPFSAVSEEELKEKLKEFGLEEYGEEWLYDGITGERMKVKIFMGVIYYQRLHHLVSNKMHARSRGPVQLLTLQPTEGRSREGGLRFGEMERDTLIGYGASMVIRERLLEESDKSIQYICKDCGGLGYMDYVKGKPACQLCESGDVKEVEVSYAFKLLLEEIESLTLFPRIIIGRRAAADEEVE
ncbi:MAG: DNA-directed RNA polymerase subunit B [Methanobacteriota archaeon]|nr:MAG: DNA-directed RNA polymerase subunit B [Euryarchaeota archaeon]